MSSSLLTHIASNFISDYENVANSSIAYLLNNYKIVRDVLSKNIDASKNASNYLTERSTDKNGRPDITGLDEKGNVVVIIEGKFWANLTNNQPVNYLKELASDGALLFLAPERRIISLKAELKKRDGGEDPRIFVQSWNNFLNSVEEENKKVPNISLASDVKQLKELCNKMDSEGMPPLSQSDLDSMNGRISYQLANLIDDCHSILKRWEHSDFSNLRKTYSKHGYGIYFKAFNYTCQLYFSNHKWYVRATKTPFWLVINKNWKKSITINNYLKHNYKSAHGSSVGIELRPGMDKSEAVEHIVTSTKKILLTMNDNNIS